MVDVFLLWVIERTDVIRGQAGPQIKASCKLCPRGRVGRGRRLRLSCRLFFFGEADFEGEATILDLSTGGCQATSLTEMQVGTTFRLSLFLHDQQWPVRIDGAMVRWVNGNSFGLEFTEIRSAQRERIRAIIMKAKL